MNYGRSAPPVAWRCIACATRFPVHRAWCTSCGATGLIVMEGERPRAAVDGLAEIATARELVAKTWKRVEVKAYPFAVGPGALVVVHGGEGAGKSTWAVRALDSIDGAVCLIAAEEKMGPTIAERLARCSCTREDFYVIGRASVDQAVRFVHEKRCTALAVDSVSVAAWRSDDLRHVLSVVPSLRVLIAVAQHNKQDEVLGERELLHEADVTIACEAMRWRVEKSRYEQAPTEPRPVLDLRRGPAASANDNGGSAA